MQTPTRHDQTTFLCISSLVFLTRLQSNTLQTTYTSLTPLQPVSMMNNPVFALCTYAVAHVSPAVTIMTCLHGAGSSS